jgi:DNA-binding CsgD family transcriptional regulator
MGGRAWATEEVALLRELATQGLSYIEIARRLGRSVHSVRIKARELGIRRQSYKRWTKDEVERLRGLLKSHSLSEIARILGRTKSSVAMKVWELGLATEHYNGLRNASSINTNLPEWVKGYIAGLLDGEGTVTINETKVRMGKKRERYLSLRPLIKIANTDREVLEWVARQVGGFRFATRNGRESKHGKRLVYDIVLKKQKDILVFLEMLLPYLIIKRRQAELVVEFCRSRLAKPNHAPYDEGELEILAEVRRLNER